MRTWTDEQLIIAVKNNNKYIDVAKDLGLTNLGSNYNTIKKYINKLNLDTSHFLNRKQLAHAARECQKTLTIEKIFSINNIDRQYIKKSIINYNLIKYQCDICGIDSWQDKKLSLHLDHINGINNDNRLENLRFLCPNCHSLTSTYCGKNKRKNNNILTKPQYLCKYCKCLITANSILCKSCRNKNKPTKIDWPNYNILLEMVNNQSYSAVGKQLGVSGNSVKKRLYNQNLLVRQEGIEPSSTG